MFLLGACAQTKSFTHESFKSGEDTEATVLLMPPDVELSELTAAGLTELRADWTELGRRDVRTALEGELAGHDATIVDDRPVEDPVRVVQEEHLQLVKLHEAVGQTILLHKYLPAYALPTKDGEFDWTLGPGVARLQAAYDADYALFVLFRDSFSSGGRVTVIVAAALLGVGVQGGQQMGFASLVDLDTGQVAWFNVMHSSTGDLRKPVAAKGATHALLQDVPL